MKKFLLPLVVALISLASCADYTDDFNTINNRLDALEQSVPTIEEQIESINAQLTSLKATDEAIKKQISELEKSDSATATEIADLKKKDSALEKSINDLQNYVDTQIANAKSVAAAAYATVEQYNTIVAQLGALQSSTSKLGEELTAKINAEVKSLTDRIADLEARLKAVEDKVENLLARIQSVSYIPEYTDGKATMKYVGTKESSEATIVFEVSPKDAVVELAKVWQSAVSVKAIYTQTRAVSFVDMPIVEFESNTENGIITVTALGENLSEEFFAGTQEASVALGISDGNNFVTSEYIPMMAKEITDEIWYTTTDNQPLTPSREGIDIFGANIVSNTYKNGVGKIAFDGIISTIGKYAFQHCKTLRHIILPNSVTEISDYTFQACNNLEEIYLSNSLITIKSMAFHGCSSLKQLTIPESVSSIKSRAFFNSGLEYILGKFSTPDNQAVIVNDDLIWVSRHIQGEFTIADGVKILNHHCFGYLKNIVSITIPDSVETLISPFIGVRNILAFYGKYTTSDNRAVIKDNILYGIAPNGLTEYIIPEGVKSAKYALFYDCGLTSVTLPASFENLSEELFKSSSTLEKIYSKAIVPPTFAVNAFKGCKNLSTIYVPTSSVDAYKTAYGWSDYADYIVGYDF